MSHIDFGEMVTCHGEFKGDMQRKNPNIVKNLLIEVYLKQY